jgi:hypothetical protein
MGDIGFKITETCRACIVLLKTWILNQVLRQEYCITPKEGEQQAVCILYNQNNKGLLPQPKIRINLQA